MIRGYMPGEGGTWAHALMLAPMMPSHHTSHNGIWHNNDCQSEASISTQIFGPELTASKAYRVHPIVDPTKFWEGVGD